MVQQYLTEYTDRDTSDLQLVETERQALCVAIFSLRVTFDHINDDDDHTYYQNSH